MLHIYRANRSESMISKLRNLFAQDPLPAIQPEHIVVDGQGMERWISLQLAAQDGVFANAYFVYPRSMVQMALDAVLGGELAPDGQAASSARYQPEVMMWSIAELLPELLVQDVFVPVREYLQGQPAGSARFVALAERIARSFDDYALFRHDMVLDWQDDAKSDLKLDPAQRWQPILWRALVHKLGDVHIAARARDFFAALQEGARVDNSFPRRLSLFGLSTMAPLYLKMLLALREQVDLHMFMLEPSAEYWSDIVSDRQAFYLARRQGQAEEDLHFDFGNPLLSSLGKQGRDYRNVIDEIFGTDYIEDLDIEPPIGDAMLQVVQADICQLVTRNAAATDEREDLSSQHIEAPLPLRAEDQSISIHACHSPMREVEVLYDQLLDLLSRDPALLPSDVVVMAPQIEDYVPYIEAVFAAAPKQAYMRFAIADRSLSSTQDLLDAFRHLLEILTGPLAAPEVLELLSRAPIAARFGIAEDELEQIETWIRDCNIRWGEDGAHRAELEHPDYAQNTWRFGLERLFVGFALPLNERDLYQDVLPYDDVEGQAGELLGRLASFTEAIFDFRAQIKTARTMQDWQALLAEMIACFIDDNFTYAQQRLQLFQAIGSLNERVAQAEYALAIDFATLRLQLDALIGGLSASHGFLTGGITFCSMLPMRAIPFKVLCLMGMNDNDFPRSQRAPGFDLMASRMRPGDRNSRDDDRYLFLEALLSARQKLIISYRGQSIQDNSKWPPSVVVSELIDVLADSFYLPETAHDDGDSAKFSRLQKRQALLQRIQIDHPLQAFSPSYFQTDGDARMFSYSTRSQDLAQTLSGPRKARPHFVEAPLELDADFFAALTLQDLSNFLRHPTRSYLRKALSLYLEQAEQSLDDIEPIELNGLERWQLYDPMLHKMTAGLDEEQARKVAEASGQLPYAAFARVELEQNLPVLQELNEKVQHLRHGEALDPVDFSMEFENGVGGRCLMTGLLRELWPQGRVALSYSKARGYQQLPIWVDHLARCALAPAGYSLDSYFVARFEDSALSKKQKESAPASKVFHYAPLSQSSARDLLQELVHLYFLGHQLPLPLFKNASWAFAQAWWDPENPDEGDDFAGLAAAQKAYESNSFSKSPGDEGDIDVKQVFQQHDPLARGFQILDWPHGEVEDFLTLAKRVYKAMFLAQEGGAA